MSFANEQSRLRSIYQFLASCSIPLLTDFGDTVRILGTGTLFEAVGKQFLITALHVLKDFDPNDALDVDGLSRLEWNDVGLPLTRQASGTRNVWTIPKGLLLLPTDDLYDVAIVEIQDKNTVRKLKRTWHFISPSNIDAVGVPADEFIMVGYPNPRIDLTFKAGERFDSKLFCNITRKFRGSLDNLDMKIPLDERVDLLLEHSDKVPSADGTTGPMPDLGGASGCSVWRLGPAGNDSEDPQSHIKLVATFSSVVEDPHGVVPEPPFERAKLAHLLWNIFRKTHLDVAEAIKRAQSA